MLRKIFLTIPHGRHNTLICGNDENKQNSALNFYKICTVKILQIIIVGEGIRVEIVVLIITIIMTLNPV